MPSFPKFSVPKFLLSLSPAGILANPFVREVIGVAISGAILFGGVTCYKSHERAVEKDRAEAISNKIAVQAADIKVFNAEHERDAAVKRADSVAAWAKTHASVQVIKYRTIRDTINIADTTQVKAGFVAADSAIAADSIAIATCDTARKETQASLDSVKIDRERVRAERDSAIYKTIHGHFPTDKVVVSKGRAIIWILGAVGAGYAWGHR